VLGKVAQRAACDLGVDHQHLDGGDQRVAAERHAVPRDARHRQQPRLELLDQDPQVHLASPQEALVEEGIVGPDGGRQLLPATVGGLQRLECVVLQVGEADIAFAQLRDHVHHQTHGLLRVQVVGIGQRRAFVTRRSLIDHQLRLAVNAVQAVVGKNDAVFRHLWGPAGPPGRAGLVSMEGAHGSPDIEHVQKIRLDVQRALDVDRLAAAILNTDALVQAPVDESRPPDAETLLGDAALAFVQQQDRVDHLEGGHVALIHGGR